MTCLVEQTVVVALYCSSCSSYRLILVPVCLQVRLFQNLQTTTVDQDTICDLNKYFQAYKQDAGKFPFDFTSTQAYADRLINEQLVP